jgi:hypothetical protein
MLSLYRVRYGTIYYYDVVGYSRSDVKIRCLVSLMASISLITWCLYVVVALIVGWDGLPGCCDVY